MPPKKKKGINEEPENEKEETAEYVKPTLFSKKGPSSLMGLGQKKVGISGLGGSLGGPKKLIKKVEDKDVLDAKKSNA
jgi:hypothetical protein